MTITLDDVVQARSLIDGRTRLTPVIAIDPGTFGFDAPVTLKCEYMQHSGSFKVRGSLTRIATAAKRGPLPEAGVVIGSGGSAGLAAAWAARRCGTTATVFLPTNAPAVKIAKLRTLGANVELHGSEYAEAFEAATAYANSVGALQLHAYDQPEICAGAGTLGLELLEQTGGVDVILVAVGGGGLMSGVATAVHGKARVVGVEPAGIPTLNAALAAGRPVDVEVASIAADALGARRLGEIAFDVATRTGVESVLVADDAIIAARQALWDHCRIVVEHGGATALAALMTGAYVCKEGERVAVVLCGANTNPSDLVA
jgi:threonine dehydratase